MEVIKELLKEPSNKIAVIALLVSIISSLYALRISIKINKINLKANIFNSLFFNLLFEKYSKLFTNISTWNSQNLDEIEDFIIECKQKLDTYRFLNKKFYKKITDEIKILDDYIVELDFNKLTIKDFKKIENLIANMYQLFLKEYLN